MSRKKKTEDPQPTPSEVLPAEVNESVAEDIQESIAANEIVPSDEAEPVRPHGPVTDTILVRHEFTDQDIARFAHDMVDHRSKYGLLEAELASVKKNYAAKLDDIDLKVDRLSALISDGFEMVEVQAIVMVYVDKENRTAEKIFYRRDNGQFIKREPQPPGVELDFFTLVPEGHEVINPLPKEVLDGVV